MHKPVPTPNASPTQYCSSSGYEHLVALFHEWRAFERAPMKNNAPDYSAARMLTAHVGLAHFQARLNAINTENWNSVDQADWQIVRAEMNGFDFMCRVLQPWSRDPAFYLSVWTEQSDVPAHEGPSHHALIELWQYHFPLGNHVAERLTNELRTIPPLLAQARTNLTGNARDLWIAGITTMAQQSDALADLTQRINSHEHAILNEPIRDELLCAMGEAFNATEDFIAWLKQQAEIKTGPSGIGIENYNWYQQHVRLVPLDWHAEVALLQRELDRAWASLKLEEQRNQHLPPLVAANTPEEYARRADHAVTKIMAFLRDKNVMPIKANMEPALREHMGEFVPEHERHFFKIGAHYDPTPLFCHFYHWFELAQMRDEPHVSPIRRGPLLYNIWDSRNEGIATGVEEMFMHMGLHDDNPRAREIVWIMLAQRAARGLGSLYAHANQMTMMEASQVHVKWTPRGWMQREPHLLQFEQHLYLRQPGYGTSYVTGKYLVEQMIAQRAKQCEDEGREFIMREFFEGFNERGCIPASLLTL